MNKEESLTFLQSCMEKVMNASAQDIQFYKEVYKLDCVPSTEVSDFEFVFPTIDLQCNYEINGEFDLDVYELDNNKTPKKKLEYSFLGESLLNQQNNDDLPYAA